MPNALPQGLLVQEKAVIGTTRIVLLQWEGPLNHLVRPQLGAEA